MIKHIYLGPYSEDYTLHTAGDTEITDSMTTLASDQAVTVNDHYSLTFFYSNNGILYVSHSLFWGISGSPTLKAGTKYIIFPYNSADKMVIKLADKDSNILYAYAWSDVGTISGINQITELKGGAILNTRRIRIE